MDRVKRWEVPGLMMRDYFSGPMEENIQEKDGRETFTVHIATYRLCDVFF